MSRALNDSERISEPVREKIKKLAKDLHYVPNASAFSLKKKMNRAIAVVTPTVEFPGGEFYQEIVKGVDRILSDNNFSILLATYHTQRNTFERMVLEGRIDGAVVLGDVFADADLQDLNEINIPIVVLNQSSKLNLSNLIYVTSNDFELAEELTEHIVVKHNRKKFLFIGGGYKYKSSRERLNGFLKVMKKYDLKYLMLQGEFAKSLESGKMIVGNLIKKNKFDFDAIVCANDYIAIGVINALNKGRLKIPKDVAIFGWDNTRVSQFVGCSPISTVEPNALEMGVFATKKLLKWVEEKIRPVTNNFVINGRVIYKNSCGCG